MARNRERYVSGPRELVEVPIAATTVVQKGDFVCLDPRTGLAVAASGLADVGDAAANREWAADNFLGVAETAHRATDPAGKIVVDISQGTIFKGELQAAASLSFGAQLEVYASADNASAYQMVAGTTSKIAYAVESITSGTDINVMLLPQARLGRATPQT
jgi:hypothetical protein